MTSDLAPIVFGLLSAAAWGAGDFCGGLATKRSNVYGVLIGSQAAGCVALVMMALAFSERMPAFDQMAWGGVAGLAGAFGLIALYTALATGRMSAAAPVSAVIAALIPASFGILVQGVPNLLKLFGFGLALIGVWFVSSAKGSVIDLRQLQLPILAGLGFGVFLIIINRVSDVSIFWPLVAARLAALIALLLVTTITQRPRLPDRTQLRLIVLAGLMDALGNSFFALAGRVGRLDVAAVLASLYPASTVALARLILKERITRMQSIGIAATLIAIVLITI
ncbi:MAG TPA: DMT family transporter [Anaerolineae bacterium]|nr:DMT family transporter [Anaerolineae bacterium]